MKFNQVTIKDIARELGISPSTVSRALKDHPDISSETKKAVSELADRLNYQPNIVALSLRQRKTNTIGVIIPEIVHFYRKLDTKKHKRSILQDFQVPRHNSGHHHTYKPIYFHRILLLVLLVL